MIKYLYHLKAGDTRMGDSCAIGIRLELRIGEYAKARGLLETCLHREKQRRRDVLHALWK